MVDDHHVERIERFTQSIGEAPFSEIELAVPGESVDQQVATLSAAFDRFTGSPLDPVIMDRFRQATIPQFGLAVRIRGGQIVRVGALAPGLALETIKSICADGKLSVDPKLDKIVGALGEGIVRVEYGRAGERAGVDVYLEPGEPASKATPPPAEAN
ncbi:MAG TPA: hypothetical protein VGC41_12140 [Kofleriaceae bacterium]